MVSALLASATDLSKLTVPQLKSLCKERHITGYSKLGKNALVQKLTNGGSNIANCPTIPTTGPYTAPPCHSAATVLQKELGDVALQVDRDPTSLAGSKKGNDETARDSAKRGPGDISLNNQRYSPIITVPDTSPVDSKVFPSADLDSGLKRATEDPSERPAKRKKLTSAVEPVNSTGRKFAFKDLSKSTQITPSPSPSAGAKSCPKTAVANLQLSATVPAASSVLSTSSRHISTVKETEGPMVSTNHLTSVLERPIPARLFASALSSKVQPPRNLVTNSDSASHKMAKDDPKGLLPRSSRFKPLKTTGPLLSSRLLNAPVPLPQSLPGPVPLFCLDFPLAEPPPMLETITLPPSKSQRKHVNRFAVILGSLSNSDRANCALASKVLRYAVYLSARHLLRQNFAGRRLSLILQECAVNMIDLWPYLRQRQRELYERKAMYETSFLADFFETSSPISPRLWASPDHEKQIIIALRFLLTRIWFLLSIGGEICTSWSRGIVTDAQEIVKGEIWTVTIQRSGKAETFYVLEETCEVIGRPSLVLDAASVPNTIDDSIRLRADWSAYIAHRVLPPSAHDVPPTALMDHLRWTNYEEYERGISKLWLKRLASEGALGHAKQVVAERYVLACVVSNSVSGKWMSSAQMAQEFAGLACGVTPTPTTAKALPVHLFLPGHHHVESLHFAASNGTPLHPGLAVVQTSAREYYILKDNGMQVGCEEDGVSDVWRRVLGCTRLGLAMTK